MASREHRREREFYRYYNSLLDNEKFQFPFCDLNKPEQFKQHIPRSGPDTALTAFCQLGALRLGTRRCMIFSFDRDHAYVLAEATQTLSLQDDEDHAFEDGLWLGHAVLPRGCSVCEHTVNIPEANQGSNRHHQNAGEVHIINDLQDDVRFCHRPFVVGGPRARFYAGVPLLSPNGTRIGAYCVLDERPRDGLDDRDVGFLRQMSRTVMDHLEAVRARSEFSKGGQILTSLDRFFELTSPATSPLPNQKREPLFATEKQSRAQSPHVELRRLSSTPSHRQLDAGGSQILDNANGVRRTSKSTEPAPEELSRDAEMRHTFQTAATLIRRAADTDGVLFLDSTLDDTSHERSGHQAQQRYDRRFSSNASTPGADAEQFTDSDDVGRAHKSQEACSVLGLSVRSSADPLLTSSKNTVPAKLLRALLRRYPQGKVWNFSSDGEASPSDSASDSGTAEETGQKGQESSDAREQRPLPKVRPKRSETEELQAIIPGVRALCLVALWDPIRERTHAGALVWSKAASRVFTPQGELSYVRAFCEVVTSSNARLEARKMDEVKSLFISSISHELRSPLHGIIGSIDFLQEQKYLDWSIVRQIEKCSITLLDVIDHLLDFAKINNLAKTLKKGSTQSGADSGGERASEHHAADRPDEGRVQDLAQATEDIADAIYYSHCYNISAEQCSKVRFILDISAERNTRLIASVGAWKRICMNLISNALKYTTEGHIQVSLQTTTRRDRKGPVAVFTVQDTGCGMSKEFLEHRMFRPFTQEDSLSTGTGLGMSLVAKLVKALRGTVEVQSTKHAGTTTIVTVPIEPRIGNVPPAVPSAPSRHLKLRVLGPSSAEKPDRRLQLTVLERTCSLLGATFVRDAPEVDVIFEANLDDVLRQQQKGSLNAAPSWIVLCDTFMSASRLRTTVRERVGGRRVVFVSQPFGYFRMADAIATLRDGAGRGILDGSGTNGVPHEKSLQQGSDTEQVSSWTGLANPVADTNPTSPAAVDTTTMNRKGDPFSPCLSPMTIATPSDGVFDIEENPFDGQFPSSSLQSNGGATENPTLSEEALSDVTTKLSLLLVDDNPINLRLLTTYAERNGHPSLSAIDGQAAVHAYQAASAEIPLSTTDDGPRSEPPALCAADPLPPAAKPDVVFMDINMPVMDGYEASRRIRTLEKARGLEPATIVALTGLGSAEAREMARRSGIDVFLTKPVRPRELKDLLDGLEQRRIETRMRDSG